MPQRRFEPKNVARTVLTLGGLALAFGIGAFNMPEKKKPLVLTPLGDNAITASDEVLVHVVGEVKSPGLYRLKPGSRIVDVIEKAGGSTDSADLQAINLAQILKDGQQLEVPAKEDFEPAEVQPFAALSGNIQSAPQARQTTRRTTSKATTSKSSKSKLTQPKTYPEPKFKKPTKKADTLTAGAISINTASASQLERLPGIGPATASNIIGYRRENGGFSSIDDLINVRGIGPKKLAAIRRFVRL